MRGLTARRDGTRLAASRRADRRTASFAQGEAAILSKTRIVVSGAQLRMARAAMHWTMQDLSRAANVAPETIRRIETDLPARPSSFVAVRVTLERAGIVFMRHRDGDGVQLMRAAECVRDLLELADIAAGKAKIDTAIRERLDRFLAASIAWQKEWHLQDGVYVRQLKKRIRAASIRVEPNVRGALEQALSYIKQMTRSSLY
jgi:transcriptional regulator with XRE-family HTH domain